MIEASWRRVSKTIGAVATIGEENDGLPVAMTVRRITSPLLTLAIA
jgi:hypothetical protein